MKISAVGNNTQTALHAASAKDQTVVVKFLIEQGADVNAIGLYPPSSERTSFTSPL
jgi:ankyrin repeat protein